MSAAMRMHSLVRRIDALIHTLFFSEIKFGALLDNLPERTDFLATGRSPT